MLGWKKVVDMETLKVTTGNVFINAKIKDSVNGLINI